jgi:Cytidylate kinase-like family
MQLLAACCSDRQCSFLPVETRAITSISGLGIVAAILLTSMLQHFADADFGMYFAPLLMWNAESFAWRSKRSAPRCGVVRDANTGMLSMVNKLSQVRWSDTLQHLSQHWEEQRQIAEAHQSSAALLTPTGLTIALAREAGIPSAAVAEEIGRRLGWQVYDHELLDRIAQDMGLRTSLLESVDERRVNLLLELFEGLLSVPYVSEGAYFQHLVKTVLALGARGECVIVGRGAALILPPDSTLRVCLVAPRNDRIAMRAHELGLSSKEAARQVDAMDRERNRFVRDHLLKDPTDPRNYDLNINFARFRESGCAELVIKALEEVQSLKSKVQSRTPELHP